jgi:translation initiation factor 1
LEKRRNGKVVTTVRGLDPVASDLPGILKSLRQRCATGGTVGDEGTIELQGDHRQRVAEALRMVGYAVKS